MAAASLRAYAPGLVGFILVKVLAPGYFARQDARTPVRIGARALVVGMALSGVFVVTLLYTAWAPAHAGIAAATACAALLNAAGLLAGLQRSGVYVARPGWKALALRVLAPSVIMGLALGGGLAIAGDWYAMDTFARVTLLAALVGGGAAVYFVVCHLVGLRARDLRLQAVA
jgi:putative peptidoglycan lipid II flippase